MILRELFYYDQITTEPGEQKQYDNKARKAGEFHKDEQQKELDFVRQMYGAANQPEM